MQARVKANIKEAKVKRSASEKAEREEKAVADAETEAAAAEEKVRGDAEAAAAVAAKETAEADEARKVADAATAKANSKICPAHLYIFGLYHYTSSKLTCEHIVRALEYTLTVHNQ